MTTKLTTEKAIERIETAKHDPELRVTRRMEIGQGIQQGDCYLIRVADEHPHGAKRGSRQVALGTTIGSRHIAEGDEVDVFEGAQLPPGEDVRANALLGPLVRALKGLLLTHPEHAHHKLPGGTYQVIHQRDEITDAAVRD